MANQIFRRGGQIRCNFKNTLYVYIVRERKKYCSYKKNGKEKA